MRQLPGAEKYIAVWDAAKEATEDAVLEAISTVVQLSDKYLSQPDGVLSTSSKLWSDSFAFPVGL